MPPSTSQQETPQPVDTVIEARWVLPIVPRHQVLEDYSVIVDKSHIIALLPTTQAQTLYCGKQTVTLPHHAVMPGLINAHCHAAMALLRGYADDKPLDRWLQDYIWPAEERWVSEEFVYDGALLAMAEMLRSGTTSVIDMYFFPNMTARAAEQAGIRALLPFPVLDFPSAWAQDADEYIHKGLQFRDDFKNSPLIEVGFGPHAPYTVSDNALRRVATLAAELDAPIQIHLHETAREVTDSVTQFGMRPIQRLETLGLLTPRTQCVHMTTLDEDDIAAVRNAGSHVIHCPRSNLKLASGFCPVGRLLKEDINVAIGTDGAASNNTLNLFADVTSAALLAKAVAGDAATLNDWQALEMATLAGARAMGRDDVLGSLEPGKRADIIAIDMSAPEQQPLYAPASQMVYTDSGNRVSHSWINGRQVLDNRHLTQIELEPLLRRVEDWRQRITN